MSHIRIALCQLNQVVGDFDGNATRILDALALAEDAGCDLAAFPELAVMGYPPEDLVLRPDFVEAGRQTVEAIAAETGACVAIFGFVDRRRDLHNAAAVCAHGEVLGTIHKEALPNYLVFDEARYFVPGDEPPQLFRINGVAVGVSICEDAWRSSGAIASLASGGAELVVNLNASPFTVGKQGRRERLIGTRAADSSVPICYVNLVGGQDELVFDGGSFVVDAEGELLTRSPSFVPDVTVTDVEIRPAYRKRMIDPRDRPDGDELPVLELRGDRRSSTPEVRAPTPDERPSDLDQMLDALVLATRDYVDKNDFRDVVIGLSGGIDSSLVAAIAVLALGPDRVHGVLMPSRYSSDHSISDAEALSDALGIDRRTIEIEPAHAAFLAMLGPLFEGLEPGLAEENVQSRVRGVTLMALSNKLGWLVLTTSNKSESAVGYATLYGDTAGGFSVIKDVSKLDVYALCELINERHGSSVIPDSVLTKPPSAELRPDQRDDQSLPPYEVLDPILEAYVVEDRSVEEIAQRHGHDVDLVRRVISLVDRAEFKRRQSAPGARVSSRAFGRDRRLPITNKHRS